jgi:hydroxymethylpyrimidine/phosphomethylpyrimidine kinase
VVLEPSDLPPGVRKHGHANMLSAALAYYLSCGEQVDEAMLHARTYLSQLPAGYTEDNSRSGELFNLFLDVLNKYYYRYSDVAFYAEQLGVSARYLGQVTRHVANRSPKSVIDERITEEISAMLDTNKPLKEIARLLGFSSQAHLSRYYKKQTGKAPSEVRKR